MKRISHWAGLGAILSAVACGGGGAEVKGGGGTTPVDKNGTGVTNADGTNLSQEAVDAFGAAVAEFKKHEDARDWDAEKCQAVAKQFLDAGKAQGGKFPAAHYDAGVALLRCGKDADASQEFEIALSEGAELNTKDPVFHQVWVQKALIKYHGGNTSSISEAIEMIETKGFDPDGSKNVEAFVNLGMLYRERWNKDPKNATFNKKDKFGFEDDLSRAQFWLQNALSINDSFMPAYNQLALFYLDKARAVGQKTAEKVKAYGTKKDREELASSKIKADLQTLETGQLVAEEASRRDPDYAAIWNTQGLILLEMNRTGAATQAFKRATEKDAKFFEAWMNYAAINLAFRGYGEASTGYKNAADIDPKSYDAKLGYAVALRGQLDFHLTAKQAMQRRLNECKDPEKGQTPVCQDANAKFPAQITEHDGKFKSFFSDALKAYEEAKALDGTRPEAFFDGALLVEKYKDKAQGTDNPSATYREAGKLFDEVATKFASDPKYKDLAAKAKVRAGDDIKAAEALEKPINAAPPAAAPATPPTPPAKP